MIAKLFSRDSVKAGLLFFVILLILFSAVFFKGYIFGGGDSSAAQGMTYQLNLHLRETGEYPLWQPYIFSGMPAFSSMMYTKWVYMPGIILDVFHKMGIPSLWTMILHYILAAMGVYTLFRYMKLGFEPALLAGLAYMLTPFFVVMMSAGHGSQMMTAAYLPWLIYAVKRIYDEPNLKALLILSVVAGFQFQRGHVQIAYYGWMAAGWYIVIETIFRARNKEWKGYLQSSMYLVAGLALGIGLAAVLYIPSLNYAASSIRGGSASGGLDYGYATSWSFPPYEVLALFFSDWFGFGGQSYWGGRPFTEHTDYLGLVLILLSLSAFLNRDRLKEKIFLASAIFLALLVSFGSYWPYLYDLLFKMLPFFNKFRVPSMILILLELLVACLAGFGLHALLTLSDERKRELKKTALVIAGSLGGLFVLALLAKGVISSSFAQSLASSPKAHPQLSSIRIDMFYGSLIKSLFMGSMTAGLIWTYFDGKVKGMVLSSSLIALVVLDLGHVDLRFTKNAAPANRVLATEQESPAIRALKELTRTNPGRIFPVQNLFGSNIWALHGLESIGGYSPAKLKVLQDFLNSTSLEQTFLLKYYSQTEQGAAPKELSEVDPQLRKRHLDVLRDLNVTYLVSQYPINDPEFILVDRGLHFIRGQRTQIFIYEFADAYPRTWFVTEVVTFEDPKALSGVMNTTSRDLSEVAYVLDPEQTLSRSEFSGGNAELISKDFHELQIKTSSEGEGFLVTSEVFYSGWTAYVDDAEVPFYQVNELIRGLVVPAGEHVVKYVYTPAAVRTGFIITLLSFLIVLALAGYLIYEKKRSKASA